MLNSIVRLSVVLLCSLALIGGCDKKKPNGGDGGGLSDGAANTRDGATGPGGDGGIAGRVDAWSLGAQVGCSGTVYACGDGQDNDGDGKIDSDDPECVGPCDNDEGSFATGISGDNVDACKQDCFFDGNSGGGDDKCDWNLRCDSSNPGASAEKPCPYDPDFKNCDGAQSNDCRDACLPYTPNGCDCFGCCEVFINGQSQLIFLGSANCSTDNPDDCGTCTQSTECVNDCEECELCLGKTIADLPASCFPASPDGGVSASDAGGSDAGGANLPSCPTGITPCLSNLDCAGDYCLTGCCRPPIQ